MALTTHPIYGDTEQLYNILSTSGLFTSVTKAIVDSTKTITCSDTFGTRLVVKVNGVAADGSGGTACGYIYHYGVDKTFYCVDYSGEDYEAYDYRFPYIVYQTTTTIVIACNTMSGSQQWPMKVLVLTKDNNGYVGILSSTSNSNMWSSDLPRSLSKDASSPMQYVSGNRIANLGSASTLVPVTTNDFSKVTYFPKLFRAVCSQYQSNNIGLATMNDNEYLSLYGAVFVRID